MMSYICGHVALCVRLQTLMVSWRYGKNLFRKAKQIWNQNVFDGFIKQMNTHT